MPSRVVSTAVSRTEAAVASHGLGKMKWCVLHHKGFKRWTSARTARKAVWGSSFHFCNRKGRSLALANVIDRPSADIRESTVWPMCLLRLSRNERKEWKGRQVLYHKKGRGMFCSFPDSPSFPSPECSVPRCPAKAEAVWLCAQYPYMEIASRAGHYWREWDLLAHGGRTGCWAPQSFTVVSLAEKMAIHAWLALPAQMELHHAQVRACTCTQRTSTWQIAPVSIEKPVEIQSWISGKPFVLVRGTVESVPVSLQRCALQSGAPSEVPPTVKASMLWATGNSLSLG